MPRATSASQLLDRKAITELRGIPERYARRILNERRVPVVKLGRRVFVWTHDLDAYLEGNTLPAVKRGNS
jgi:hypothetical protein